MKHKKAKGQLRIFQAAILGFKICQIRRASDNSIQPHSLNLRTLNPVNPTAPKPDKELQILEAPFMHDGVDHVPDVSLAGAWFRVQGF